MTVSGAPHQRSAPVFTLGHESLYVGIDVGKQHHVAGFVSATLLRRHERFDACPALSFANARDGFRALVDRIQSYVPLTQVFVLLEHSGHYHHVLQQYLLELDLPVFLIPIQRRPQRSMKSDKRDALGLANQLYNHLEKGIQVSDNRHVIRRALPPTETALLVRDLVRHRYELIHDSTRRKNKLIAICDELFPEFTTVLRDPNAPSALALRARFPTPVAIAAARIEELGTVRLNYHPPIPKLVRLQQLADQSIGTKDVARQRSLVFEQTQLTRELTVIQGHLLDLDKEISQIMLQSREGQILLSIPGIGQIEAATLLGVIGNVANFRSAAALKAYLGWAPRRTQTGSTLDHDRLSRTGNRTTKHVMFLVVANAIQMDCAWARLYARLVPRKCTYDERTRRYTGKVKVMGRIAGQMITMIYALLKHDAEVLETIPVGHALPPPLLYDPAVHEAHRAGHYHPLKPKSRPPTMTQVSGL